MCTIALLTTSVIGAGLSDASHADFAAPDEPEHGFDDATYYPLWSGDDDTGVDVATVSGTVAGLATVTDIAFDQPPIAVEHWNRLDHSDFPPDDPATAVRPSGAETTDGEFVKDASVSVFAVQPSTRVHLDTEHVPLYVAPDGTVLGVVDYRVDVPAASARDQWTITSHGVRSTRLLIDGITVATTAGTRTPRLDYRGLDASDGGTHTLTLMAQIDVELERETTSRRTVCTTVNQTTQCRIATQRTTKTFNDSVTVQDSITVTVDAPVLSGLGTMYPNGDRGFANTIDGPWSAYSVPGGTVRGVWQFYSARDPTWDTLTVTTSTGEAQRASPLVPLQVHAYPSRRAPITGSPLTVDVLGTGGHVTPVPTLPEVIALDTPAEPYLANATVAARFSGLDDASTVAVSGLVRGVEHDAPLSAFPERAMRPVSLRLTVQETTPETVTLELALHETDTGLPVSTASMGGTLSLDGVRLNTSSDGTVIRTVSRDTGIHTARFVPHSWWNSDATYAPASDTVYVREIPLDGIDALYRLGVYTMVFGVAAFLIDRTTGWRIWPPWRDL